MPRPVSLKAADSRRNTIILVITRPFDVSFFRRPPLVPFKTRSSNAAVLLTHDVGVGLRSPSASTTCRCHTYLAAERGTVGKLDKYSVGSGQDLHCA